MRRIIKHFDADKAEGAGITAPSDEEFQFFKLTETKRVRRVISSLLQQSAICA
jgi:hypothetical protein